MKLLRTETIHLKTEAGEITLDYTLVESSGDLTRMSYGIALCNRDTTELVYVLDITSDPETARTLFEHMVKGSVTTISFRDVVEDFLAAG